MGQSLLLHRNVILSIVACAAAVVLAGQDASASEWNVRIVLAGDSTVTDDAGWGLGFKKALNDSVEPVNLSRGGRSSKSFRDEGLWEQVLDAKPDYVLIQFGHNTSRARGPRARRMRRRRFARTLPATSTRLAPRTPRRSF